MQLENCPEAVASLEMLQRCGLITAPEREAVERLAAPDGRFVNDKREKALIGLALAHALKCPYCIDAYTGTLSGLGVSEAEMNEAVHVASAMAAGITLVHSVQMMNKLDQTAAGLLTVRH